MDQFVKSFQQFFALFALVSLRGHFSQEFFQSGQRQAMSLEGIHYLDLLELCEEVGMLFEVGLDEDGVL